MDSIQYRQQERRRRQMIDHKSVPPYRPSNRIKNIFWFSMFFAGIVYLIVYVVSE